jgi:hypothetical protein
MTILTQHAEGRAGSLPGLGLGTNPPPPIKLGPIFKGRL